MIYTAVIVIFDPRHHRGGPRSLEEMFELIQLK
jgi:hypothetical protein